MVKQPHHTTINIKSAAAVIQSFYCFRRIKVAMECARPTLVNPMADPQRVLDATVAVVNDGRGDCLMYSMQYHLHTLGTPVSIDGIRAMGVDYVVTHWGKYQEFALDDHGNGFRGPREYAAHAGRPGVYADHVLMHALCRTFGITAYVLRVDPRGRLLGVNEVCSHPGWPIMPFRFQPEYHYEALRRA